MRERGRVKNPIITKNSDQKKLEDKFHKLEKSSVFCVFMSNFLFSTGVLRYLIRRKFDTIGSKLKPH